MVALCGLGLLVLGLHAALPGGHGATSAATPATTSSPALASRTATFPMSDFTYFYGPLAPFAAGSPAASAGRGSAPRSHSGSLLALAIVAATYALARTQSRPARLRARRRGHGAAVAFSPTNLSFVLPHTFSATLAVLARCGFLLGLARYAAAVGRGRWSPPGLASGLSVLTRPEFEAAAIFAAASG